MFPSRIGLILKTRLCPFSLTVTSRWHYCAKPNPTGQPPGASGRPQKQIERQRRLAPVADLLVRRLRLESYEFSITAGSWRNAGWYCYLRGARNSVRHRANYWPPVYSERGVYNRRKDRGVGGALVSCRMLE